MVWVNRACFVVTMEVSAEGSATAARTASATPCGRTGHTPPGGHTLSD